jgi:hypothetical protein
MVYWVYHVIGQNWVPLCNLQHGFWGYPIIRLTRGAHRRTSANASPHGGMRCAIARKPPGMEAKDIRRINRLFQRVYTGGNQWSPNNGLIYIIYILYIYIHMESYTDGILTYLNGDDRYAVHLHIYIIIYNYACNYIYIYVCII